MQPQPTALIISTTDGEFAPLIAARLKRHGFNVEALCQRGHSLSLSNKPTRVSILSFARPMASLAAAITAANAAVMIACDDPARYLLSRYHAACVRRGTPAALAIAAQIEQSLGAPANFQHMEEKSQLLADLAHSDVRVPRSIIVRDRAALSAACDQLGFPLVLKRDRTYGGQGVIICHNRDEAMIGWSNLMAPPAVWDILRRVIKFGDLPALRREARHPAITIAAQAWVEGQPANRAAACRNGKVLAGLTVIAREMHPPPMGPAAVVQIIRNADMERMTETIVRRLGLSGVCGCDFILDEASGRATFLELNARATPTSPLGRTRQSDIYGALWHSYTGQPTRDAAAHLMADPEDLIAIFPTEWRRDPNSPHLSNPHNCVPLDDPKIMDAFAAPRAKPPPPLRTAIIAQAWAFANR